MTWRRILMILAAAGCLFFLVGGLVLQLALFLPGGEALFQPHAGNASPPASMELRRILAAILMAPLAAFFGLVACLLAAWDRSHRRRELDFIARQEVWGQQAMDWWLVQVAKFFDDPAARAFQVQEARRSIQPYLAAPDRAWLANLLSRIDGNRAPELRPEPGRWLLREPWIGSAAVVFGGLTLLAFWLGAFNGLAQLLMKAYPERNFFRSSATVAVGVGLWWAAAAGFAAVARGFRRSSREIAQPGRSSAEGKEFPLRLEALLALAPVRQWSRCGGLMEAMTATLAAQRLRQKEESAGRGRMRHAHLVNIELAGMALFHVSLFFAAVMTGFGLFTLYSLDVADPSGVAIQLSQRFGIEVSALILLLVSIAGLALPTSFFIFLAWALRKLVAVPYAAQLAAPKKRFPNDP